MKKCNETVGSGKRSIENCKSKRSSTPTVEKDCGIKDCEHKSCTSKKKSPASTKTAGQKTTKIVAHVDVGWGKQLFLRGDAPFFSWDKGIILKNVDGQTWEWETTLPCKALEFKLLIDDIAWSKGANYVLKPDKTLICRPQF